MPGRIGSYEFYVKTDSDTAPTRLPGAPGFPTAGEWTLVTSDAVPDEASRKEKVFPSVTSRYVLLEAVTEAGNRGLWMSLAEFQVLGSLP